MANIMTGYKPEFVWSYCEVLLRSSGCRLNPKIKSHLMAMPPSRDHPGIKERTTVQPDQFQRFRQINRELPNGLGLQRRRQIEDLKQFLQLEYPDSNLTKNTSYAVDIGSWRKSSVKTSTLPGRIPMLSLMLRPHSRPFPPLGSYQELAQRSTEQPVADEGYPPESVDIICSENWPGLFHKAYDGFPDVMEPGVVILGQRERLTSGFVAYLVQCDQQLGVHQIACGMAMLILSSPDSVRVACLIHDEACWCEPQPKYICIVLKMEVYHE
ncbi:hypothetical protein BU17DRAFT_62227 [Hysterangium stoloniferum]|nr:hypothetical protein BU17DRAFT_62227 [Hysterangium stoloniferum]